MTWRHPGTTVGAQNPPLSCRRMLRIRTSSPAPLRRAAGVAFIAALATGCGGRELPERGNAATTPGDGKVAVGTGAPPNAVSPIPEEWLGEFQIRVRGERGPAPGLWRLKVARAGRSDGTFTFTHVDVPKFSVPMAGRVEYGRLVVSGNPVSNCPSVGTYQVERERRGLRFTLLTDGCTDRSKFLTRVPWRPVS